jgi:hypothetical protein
MILVMSDNKVKIQGLRDRYIQKKAKAEQISEMNDKTMLKLKKILESVPLGIGERLKYLYPCLDIDTILNLDLDRLTKDAEYRSKCVHISRELVDSEIKRIEGVLDDLDGRL